MVKEKLSSPDGVVSALVAEDNKVNRALLKKYLQCFGFNIVHTAEHGEEALEICHQQKDNIVLVVSDINMPRMRGDQLFHELKRNGIRTKMVLCSDGDHDVDLFRLFDDGLAGFIQKPFSPLQLSAAVLNAFI
jgi:two-component system cell cycle sensor histidine kinase/response regulator CckA